MIILTNVQEELTKDIKKLIGNLKNEEQLTEILKRKLTKKEFKYYKLKIEKLDEKAIAKELNCDKDRFEEIKKQTVLKLNQEKIKKELVNF
ncbi:MAG: hypothetical protein U9N59_02180 [Campylobacterota bacterium]|nr:hypothetical protein [Campylobacterota bacterium]